jgi:uncharacterized protein
MFTKDKLKEIILSQKDNLNLLNEGILRNEEIKISESFANIITGIRRCGKSTFLMQILNNQKISYYLNLEDPRLEGFELSDFNKMEELMYEIYGSKGVFFLMKYKTYLNGKNLYDI